MAKENSTKRPYGAYLKIINMNPKVVEDLNNIAANEGISRSDFLKPHLRKIAESYPEHMRKKPAKD